LAETQTALKSAIGTLSACRADCHCISSRLCHFIITLCEKWLLDFIDQPVCLSDQLFCHQKPAQIADSGNIIRGHAGCSHSVFCSKYQRTIAADSDFWYLFFLSAFQKICHGNPHGDLDGTPDLQPERCRLRHYLTAYH